MTFVKDFFLLLGRTVTPIHNEDCVIYEGLDGGSGIHYSLKI